MRHPTMKAVLSMMVILVSGSFQRLEAQADMGKSEFQLEPTFFLDAISYRSDEKDGSRIDFYVQIPYEEISFVKEGEVYIGRYDIALNITTSEQKIVQDRSWSVEVRVSDFAQTRSRKLYSLTQRSADVEPGNYRVVVQMRDQESKRAKRTSRALLVTDYAKDSLSLSDIMLVSRLTTTNEGKMRVVPNISGNVGSEGEGFFLFFEVYNIVATDSVELMWKIYDVANQVSKQATQMEALTGTKTQVFVKVDDLKLSVGTYFVSVTARVPDAQGAPLQGTTSRTFSVRWGDIPFSITDIDKAVLQMQYVALPSEFEFIDKAPNQEEKRKRFVDFWAKRDPDISTSRNELMEEYYQRVEYANKHFSHYIEGWKTDRGMVYIRFGAPDNIDRHPFETTNKPFEVWYYYQIERQFVFVDQSGFGDYRLNYPTTDLWGRVR